MVGENTGEGTLDESSDHAKALRSEGEGKGTKPEDGRALGVAWDKAEKWVDDAGLNRVDEALLIAQLSSAGGNVYIYTILRRILTPHTAAFL